MNKLKDLKILVIGDIMLDKYVVGDVDRISPEAPVPIVDVTDEYCTLGGCGNVAKNLANIGVTTLCIAATGKGLEKDKLYKIMHDKNIFPFLVTCRDRPTTIKERIISKDRHTQLLRIDRESKEKINYGKVTTEIKYVLNQHQVKPDIILISDYNKGMITRDLMSYIEDVADTYDIPLIIDPKPANQYCYKKAFAITPNEKEFRSMTWESPLIKHIITTQGSKGVTIARSADFMPTEIPAETVEVYNVTGAGDSFVAIFSACIGLGIDVLQSSRIANKCSAYVVTKPGTSAVPIEIFKKAVLSIFPKGFFNGKELVFD